MNPLKKMRQQSGHTQAQVSEALSIPIATLRRWEQGRNEPNIEMIIKLADFYGCATDDLLGFELSKAMRVSSFGLPLVGRIAAGTPIEAIQESGQTHETPEYLYRKHPHGFWLTINGNSMNRLFPDGALVLIDPELEVRNGDIAAIIVNGFEATVKRFYHDPARHTITLHPESYDPDYKPETITTTRPNSPEIRLLGKVVSYSAPKNWRP